MANEMDMIKEEVEVIEIPNGDGGVTSCAVLDEFEIDDQQYIVLAEIDDNDALGEETYFFRYAEEGDEIILTPIDDEEEYTTVVAAHLDLYDEEAEDDSELVEVELETIEVPFEDGTSVLCAIIDEFRIEDEEEGSADDYVVVSPVDGDTVTDEIFYFKYTQDGEDIYLSTIDDPTEMAFVVAAHEDLFDDEEEE